MFGGIKFSKRSISRDLTIGLILVVMCVSTIALGIAYVITLKKAESELNTKANEYISFIKNTLILPIWNYDFDTVDAVVKTYLQNDLISGITLSDHRGKINIDVQKKGMEASILRSAVLKRHNIPIAKIEISLAPGYLSQYNRQLFLSFALTISINLIVLLVMTKFMLGMALKRPLDRLNLIVDAYAGGNYKTFSHDIPHVEFRPLVKTLDDMGKKIEHQVSTIKRAEKKYRSIFENALEGIYQSTAKGRILSANPAYADILGYETPEALIDSVSDIGRQHWVEPDLREQLVQMIFKKNIVSNFETRLRKKNGAVIWVAINARPIYDRRGNLLHFEGMVQDIDRRKKTEAQLQRLFTAVEQVAENIFITNDQGKISYVNPAFEKSMGYTKGALLDISPSKLAADTQIAIIYGEIWQVVSKGDLWTGLLTNQRKNGGTFVVETLASPIKSKSGRFLGYVAMNRDVTDKVTFENQLRQSQKMEAIGTLAGGIAHDFNNKLGVIIGCSELAMDHLPPDHITRQDMEKVLDAGLRAKDLVRQILTFSRQTESTQKPFLLHPFIKDVVQFLQATLPTTVDLELTITIPHKTILADPTEIQQILMNLCTNAAQAMAPDGGTITIMLAEKTIDTERASQMADLKPGPYLNITVRDSGDGIPEDMIHRIFDPFFTTKRVGEGTGLGLSVVHGIVKKYNGTILVDAPKGKGAEFQVWLPRLEHPGFDTISESIAEPPTGTERILLVENESVLADILERILKGLGYHVKSFVNSKKALSYFNENTEWIDMVLADQSMREVNGIELTNLIKEKVPSLPVVLYTGMSDPHLIKEAKRVGVNRLLMKPLNRVELAIEIRKVIDGAK